MLKCEHHEHASSEESLPDLRCHDETHWISEAARGSEEAFTLLFSKYHPMIHAYSYRLTGSSATAEDMAQLTFIKAARGIPGLEDKARFKSWLYRIASHCCHDWLRKQKRDEGICVEAALQLQETAGSDERLAALHAAVLRLPARQRQAVTLVYFENLSHREAAAIMDCAETTISWRLFLARKTLGKMLKNVED